MNEKHKHLERRSFIRLAIVGALLLISIVLSVIGLTQNSQGAKDRYDALIATDQAGGDVSAALNELQAYTYAHINTQIGGENGIKPPIQLAGTYSRLVESEQKRVDDVNVVLYERAQTECESSGPGGFSGSNRLSCIEAYVDSNGVQSVLIQDALYKFDFVSPTWSPDLAGFSIIAAFILAIVFCIDLALYYRTRRMVHMAN